MVSKISFQKNKSKVWKRILITIAVIIALFITLILATILRSEQVGDWYYKQNKFEKSATFYEMSYTIYHNFNSLDKLCLSLILQNDYEGQTKYLPKLLKNGEDSFSNKNEYYNHLADYIISLYNVGRISDYKNEYSRSIDKLVNHIQSVLPLGPLSYDPNAKNEDLIWAIELSDKLILGTDNLLLKSSIYSVQSDLYLRLGNSEKAKELSDLAEEIKKNYFK